MTFSRLFMLLPICVWLIGCVAPQPKQTDAGKVDWLQQQKRLGEISQWSINGRIAVQTINNGGQADYVWKQQNATNYTIRLQAPLGAGTTWISAEPQGVMLKNSSGESLFDTDVDKLMQQVNGWPLPVSGLRYWVLGLPSKMSDYTIVSWQANGLPGVMLQDGWRIEFRQHKEVSGVLLPKKLFISRDSTSFSEDENEEGVDVRLIIRQWSIGRV